jgi:hypothetical protein
VAFAAEVVWGAKGPERLGPVGEPSQGPNATKMAVVGAVAWL